MRVKQVPPLRPVLAGAATLFLLVSAGRQRRRRLSATNAWAVGYYLNGSFVNRPLIEHWNRTTWTLTFMPSMHRSLMGAASSVRLTPFAVSRASGPRLTHGTSRWNHRRLPLRARSPLRAYQIQEGGRHGRH